jgi:hypothetical protein
VSKQEPTSSASGLGSNLAEPPEVEAEWTTPASEQLWTQLLDLYKQVRAGSRDEDTKSETDEAIVLGPVLGDEREPRVAQCAVVKLDGTLYWQLTVSTAPDEPTPEEVTRLSHLLGGHDGLRQFIKKAVSGVEVSSVSYDISFQLRAEHWRCRVLPSPLREVDQAALAGLVPDARVEHVGYRVQDPGSEGIQQLFVSFDYEESRFLVTAIVLGELDLADGQWLPPASAVARQLTDKLFERSGGSHAAKP